MRYILTKTISLLLVIVLIVGIVSEVPVAYAETGPSLTYLLAPFSLHTTTDNGFYAIINGIERNYSDDIDITSIQEKVINCQNVVYELKNAVITDVFTINEVLSPNVKVKYTADNDLYYKDGKFSQSQFDLHITISVGINQSKVDSDFLWFFNESEKDMLILNLKGLKITTPYGADFGSTGFAFWKSYTEEVDESYDDRIKVNENQTYSFTVNLRNDKALNQSEYTMDFSVIPTFDFGSVSQTKASVKVVNIDAQAAAIEAKKEAQKESSPSGKAVASAEKTLELSGSLVTASTTFNNFFTSEQKRRLDEFAYVWVSDLILAEIIDYSEFDLNREAEELVQKKVFSKLGIDSRMLTKGESLEGSVNLLTTTKDGTEVLINYVADLTNFKFWFDSKPYGVNGQLKLSIFKLSDGSQMGMTETIIVSYADMNTFIANLQDIAKSTIFNIGKDVYGLSASKTADKLADKAVNAITDGLMTKALNSKARYFEVVSRLTAKEKSVIQKALARVLTDKIKECNQTVFRLLTTPSSAAKIHSFECPVNVKVYDNDGNLCASIVNNKVDEFFNEVFATVNGDKKEFYLIGDDYYFIITGYDSGTMDYTVREFDNNGEIRKLTYEDVPVSNGCVYYSLSPEADNMSNTFFDLVDKGGNIYIPNTGADDSSIDVDDNYVLSEGKCGDNVSYELYRDGVLELSGTGDTYDYENNIGTYSPWKDYRNKINSIIINGGITSIGQELFFDCEYLKSVSFPCGLVSISNEAFCLCDSLEKVVFPESLQTIGESAFHQCKALTSVQIPKATTEFGSKAFYGCNLFSAGQMGGEYDITFAWTTEIPKNAFNFCTSLSVIELPRTISKIGYGAFANSGLKKISLSKNIEKIEAYAFYRCEYLSEIYYDVICLEDRDEIYTYTDSIFRYAGSKTDGVFVVIGDDVTDIPDFIFSAPINITDLTIGKNVEYIGRDSFARCHSIERINYNAVSVTDYIAYQVNDDHYGPFNSCYCENGVELIIGNNVKRIPNLIFAEPWDYDEPYYLKGRCGIKCSYVKIGSGLEQFNYESLIRLSGVQKYEVSKENKWLSSENDVLFNKEKNELIRYPDNKNEKTYFIPNGVKRLGDFSFINCKNLETVCFPESVTEIGRCVFWSCKSLKKMDIPNSVTQIGYVIPSGDTEINSQTDYMFEYCSNLECITLPSCITEIGNYTFHGCINLRTITIPNNVQGISMYAFSTCLSLQSINLPLGVTEIDYMAFYKCESLYKITIPETVISIDNQSFELCHNLTIRGKIGTVAHSYAKTQSIPFEAINSGDSDSNGVVDSKDRIKLARYLAKWSGYEDIDMLAADVNSDSKVNAKDRIILARHLAKWQGYEILPYVQ